MVTRTAHANLPGTQPANRSTWRMDPPPPTGLQDLLLGAWPGAMVAMVLLGLLLAFGSVVRDGVDRGEQLRSQMTSPAWHCEAQTPASRAVQCADSAQRPAATEVTATRTLARQP